MIIRQSKAEGPSGAGPLSEAIFKGAPSRVRKADTIAGKYTMPMDLTILLLMSNGLGNRADHPYAEPRLAK